MDSFAFVNAVLGGFAFAFLGALVTIEKSSRVLASTLLVISAAAGCFLVATLGSTLYAGAVEISKLGHEMKEIPEGFTGFMSRTFLGGVFFLICGVGLIGWIRSRSLGIATTSIAVLTALGAVIMIRPFID